jgi:hypothetical protein
MAHLLQATQHKHVVLLEALHDMCCVIQATNAQAGTGSHPCHTDVHYVSHTQQRPEGPGAAADGGMILRASLAAAAAAAAVNSAVMEARMQTA